MKKYQAPLNQALLGNKSQEFDAAILSDGLYALSKHLGKIDPENQVHGLLGGEFGYGQDFKNDVFEMRPYYWGDCECDGEHKSDCPVMLPNFRHFASGIEVSWYKYIGRGMTSNQNIKKGKFGKIIDDCIGSVTK